MKKALITSLVALVLITSSFGGVKEDLNDLREIENTKTLKENLPIMKKHLPMIHTVINDYFQAKTCNENIADKVSMKDVQEFAATEQFGQLILLKYPHSTEHENILAKANYMSIMGAFKYLNCGGKEGLASFIGGTSVMCIETNSKN